MIVEVIQRPPADLVEEFRGLLCHDSVTCALSDCMGRFNAMTSDMRPLFEGIRVVGTAVTVKTLASDLAAAFKAIDVSQPGDVVVIDSHGSTNTAFWGENMTMSALNRGVIAAVIDGACRDVEEIRKIGFPFLRKCPLSKGKPDMAPPNRTCHPNPRRSYQRERRATRMGGVRTLRTRS